MGIFKSFSLNRFWTILLWYALGWLSSCFLCLEFFELLGFVNFCFLWSHNVFKYIFFLSFLSCPFGTLNIPYISLLEIILLLINDPFPLNPFLPCFILDSFYCYVFKFTNIFSLISNLLLNHLVFFYLQHCSFHSLETSLEWGFILELVITLLISSLLMIRYVYYGWVSLGWLFFLLQVMISFLFVCLLIFDWLPSFVNFTLSNARCFSFL